MPPRHQESDEEAWDRYRMFVIEALKDIQQRQRHIESELTGIKIKVVAITVGISVAVQGVVLLAKWRELIR